MTPPMIPVARPKLPDADALLPFLRQIDRSRWYGNRGPLVRRFEELLACHTEAASGEHVVVAANATAALTAALLALDVPDGCLCMIPAWTFAASAHAVVAAGLVPWIVDVDPSDGALHPATALSLIPRAPGRLGAILTVAPFGSPVDVSGWTEVRRRSDLPVVLDAAAGFDVVRASAIPTIVSLHATKVLGIGEGAFVTWDDAAGVRSIRARINFGFSGTREATVRATNAKLSEYGAALGLAALESWPANRRAWRRVAEDYANAFAGTDIELQAGWGDDWVSSTAIATLPPACLATVEGALAGRGIDSRRWWGRGLAKQRAFARYPRMPLDVTEALASSTLGLPCWPDLPRGVIVRIAGLVASASRAPQQVPARLLT